MVPAQHSKALVTLALAGLCLLAGPAAAQPSKVQQDAIRNHCRSDFMANCMSVKPGGAEALQCLERDMAKLSQACRGAVTALRPPPAPPPARAASPPPAAPLPATSAAVPQPAAPPPPAAPATPARAATPPPAAVQTPTRATAPSPSKPARPAPAATAGSVSASQQAAIRQSCQSDFMARCRGVQPGGAAALQCLQRHGAQLSPACKNAVAALGGGARPATPAAAAVQAAPAAMPTPEQMNAIKFNCRRDFMVNCRGVPQGGPEALACLERNSARLSPNCRTSIAAITEGEPAPAAAAAAAPAPASAGPFPLRRAIRQRLMNQ